MTTAVAQTPAGIDDCRASNEPVTINAEAGRSTRLLWGMRRVDLHDRYWAAHGVQVLRRGSRDTVNSSQQPMLLLEPGQLAVFELPPAARRLRRRRPRVVTVALMTISALSQRETVKASDTGAFLSIERAYDAPPAGAATVHLTNDPRVAEHWAAAPDASAAARVLRASVPMQAYDETQCLGRCFDAKSDDDSDGLRGMLLSALAGAGAFGADVQRLRSNVWAHATADVDPAARIIGEVWIGAGVRITGDELIVGPHVFDDEQPVELPRIHPARGTPWRTLRRHRFALSSRRVFDVVFSLLVLFMTAPLWPIIIAAIWLDDGWPILYRHRRQTFGGREFDCLKFRTMCADADVLKAQLQANNVCDGPQFYIENDPRETRVGRVLRRFHLDELPQFLNVLAGQMSVVGPRPSPEVENRYCPDWRATRLSVKPGITGLWQVRRTRLPNADFQEWIRFDTEYVRRRSWRMDLFIIVRTLRNMLPF